MAQRLTVGAAKASIPLPHVRLLLSPRIIITRLREEGGGGSWSSECAYEIAFAKPSPGKVHFK